MTHTIRAKPKLLARVRRIRGQIEGIERAIDADRSCADILHQITAAKGAIHGLMSELLQEHIRSHIADPSITDERERTQGAEELIDVLRSYLR